MSCQYALEIVNLSRLCTSALVDLKDYLETVKNRNILKHIFGKDRISTTLLDREMALQDSYNALLVCGVVLRPHRISADMCFKLWTTTKTYALVRKAAIGLDSNDV